MKAQMIRALLKSKFIRKYRGSSGKMVYIYQLPGGHTVRVKAEEVKHSLQTLKLVYKRRGHGQGSAKLITSKADLDLVLTQTTFCMLSAGRNPKSLSDQKLSDKAIEARDRQLRSDLVEAGYIFTPAKGKYGAPEESIFVMCHDANQKQLAALGTKYHQDSILFVRNGHSEMVETTGKDRGSVMMSGDGHEYIPDADDFYTEVDIAGKPVKFVMNLVDVVKAIRRFMIKLWKGRNNHG